MRNTRLVGLTFIVALVIGPVAFAGTASADVPAVGAGSPAAPANGAMAVASPGTTEPQASDQQDGRWTGGAVRDIESGTWRATVSNDGVTLLLGHYGTEKDARKAGRKHAKELNEGVVAGPGCDEPEVLC